MGRGLARVVGNMEAKGRSVRSVSCRWVSLCPTFSREGEVGAGGVVRVAGETYLHDDRLGPVTGNANWNDGPRKIDSWLASMFSRYPRVVETGRGLTVDGSVLIGQCLVLMIPKYSRRSAGCCVLISSQSLGADRDFSASTRKDWIMIGDSPARYR